MGCSEHYGDIVRIAEMPIPDAKASSNNMCSSHANWVNTIAQVKDTYIGENYD